MNTAAGLKSNAQTALSSCDKFPFHMIDQGVVKRNRGARDMVFTHVFDEDHLDVSADTNDET